MNSYIPPWYIPIAVEKDFGFIGGGHAVIDGSGGFKP